MAHTLESFAAKCHELLKADPGPAGRDRVVAVLEDALKDKAFIAETVGPDFSAGREILYEDKELGFCILAHVRKASNASPPHDHGPTWAIYGQASGSTEMTDWRKLKAPQDGRPGEVEFAGSYSVKPGMAKLYNEGMLHSPAWNAEARLIRLEGRNVETIRRDRYVVAETAA
ncbi:MAG: hypothetical protein WD767_19080 [Alphaproteobacteria bacterium]